MKAPILEPVGRTGFRFLVPLIVALAGLIITLPVAAQEDGPAPSVYAPVAPQVLRTDMRAVAGRMAAPQWSAGMPVRTVEDLR